MSLPDFVIASTGRSGSGYVSRVLQAYGINVGHEDYFCFPWRTPQQGLDGDSSWLSVDKLETFDGVVFHQVRHPLKVLSSLTYSYPNRVRKRYIKHRYAMMPYRTDNLIRDFSAMIIDMNRRITEHACAVWSLENFDEVTVRVICEQMGYEYDEEKALEAISDISSTYNHHNRGVQLAWEDIPESPEKVALKGQARKYNYC